ncbi:MAG: hypothetical protein ACI8S6_004577, partial [Myxococcota bacterium]
MSLLSLFLLGCQSIIQTNPCELYESEIESCFDEADLYLGVEGETSSYTIDLQCPPEEELTDAEVIYFSCLDEVWSGA